MPPPHPAVAQKQSQWIAILVFSLATLLLYVGYGIVVVSVRNDDAVGTGIIVFLVGCALYVPGFVLYRINRGKPHFVGYIMGGGEPPRQQMVVAYTQPAMHNPQVAGPEGAAASLDNPPPYEQNTALPVKLQETNCQDGVPVLKI